MSEPVEKLYRIDDYGVFHGSDDFGFHVTRHLAPREFHVIKRTAKGAWIDMDFGQRKRFVNLTARKQYACETVELARQSFIARKKRQIRILTSQLSHAKEALELAESCVPENERRAIAINGTGCEASGNDLRERVAQK